MNSFSKTGFTLIELMIVVAIIICLAMIAIPNFNYFLAKAKRAEVYVNLASLALAQKAYWAEHGRYARSLSGPEGLNWKPGGNFNYTYGLGDGESFVGQLKTPASELKNSHIGDQDFKLTAAGYINGTAKADIIAVDQNNRFEIIQDALKA
jgi:prepilin-type N-terminal cleavage/methylation domain-containing protein